MDLMKITATANSPLIDFDRHAGVLRIEGKSFVENAFEFYKPLLATLAEYIKSPQPSTIVHIKLVYFNTSSSKCILDVLRELERLKPSSEVKLVWYYEREDDDMLEVGKDYREIVDLNFHIVEVENLE